MRVHWTTDSADDLERICDYIDQSLVGGLCRPSSKASRHSERFRISAAEDALRALANHQNRA